MSAVESTEIQNEIQSSQTEPQIQGDTSTTVIEDNKFKNQVPIDLNILSSYEIDKSFEKNIKQAKVQQDFLKTINVYENSKYIYGLTEQMYLKIFTINEQTSELQEVVSKKFPQPLYDSIMIKDKFENDTIVVSIKNQPINIYRLDQNNNSEMVDEKNESKLNLKCVGYLSSQKKNTELYQTPLQFNYNEHNRVLYGVGKQFVISYDLNKFTVKDTYEKFNKSDYLSCFDIPKVNSTDYQNYADIVAFGKFDRKIEILDFKQKKIVSSFSLHLGGVTCLKFDPQNSNYLYSGARKDDLIYLWDLRKQDTFVHYYQRKCTTNQRMSFDLFSDMIAYGNQSGEITLANTTTKETILSKQIHDDCVNSVRLFEKDNKHYCISAAGQRHYQISDEQSETDSDEESSDDEIDIELEKSQNNQDKEPKKCKQQISKKEKPNKGQLKLRQENSIKLSLLQY